MNFLPKWRLTRGLPAFKDSESGTVLEQTYKVYQAMDELIKEYNDFADSVNEELEQFETKYNGDWETFTTAFRQEFQDFIDVVNLRLEEYGLNDYETLQNTIDEVKNMVETQLAALSGHVTAVDQTTESIQESLQNFKGEYDAFVDFVENKFENDIPNTYATKKELQDFRGEYDTFYDWVENEFDNIEFKKLSLTPTGNPVTSLLYQLIKGKYAGTYLVNNEYIARCVLSAGNTVSTVTLQTIGNKDSITIYYATGNPATITEDTLTFESTILSEKIADGSITPKKTSFISDNLVYENPLISFDYNGTWRSYRFKIKIKENTTYYLKFKSISGTHYNGFAYCRDINGNNLKDVGFNATKLWEIFISPANTVELEFWLYATGDTAYSGTAIYEGLELVEGKERKYKLDTSVKVNIDYTKYGLPILYLNGITSGMNKENEVTLNYVYGERTGTCTLKWQGQGSLQYPKKNYTIKFDNPFEAKEGWGSQKKYCLKANYLDYSQARNVVSAKLWGKIVNARTTPNENLNNAPNFGAVDGFPCCVVINDEYQGLYTFNIPKDKWTFGMGSGTNECIISSEIDNRITTFFDPPVIDGTNFEYEYITDENNTEWVTTSLNNLYNALHNATKENFESSVGQYLDLESAIDYCIMVGLFNGIDCRNKNYLLVSYGGKWMLSAYDLDCTFGLHWDGKIMTPDDPFLDTYQYNNKIMECIFNFYRDKLKARYLELRKNVLSDGNVETEFINFVGSIPKALYDEEVKIWNEIPLTSVSNVHQIISFYKQRCKYTDNIVNNY